MLLCLYIYRIDGGCLVSAMERRERNGAKSKSYEMERTEKAAPEQVCAREKSRYGSVVSIHDNAIYHCPPSDGKDRTAERQVGRLRE